MSTSGHAHEHGGMAAGAARPEPGGGHGSEHDHAHAPGAPLGHRRAHHHEAGRRRLVVVLILTAVFMLVELVGGWIANSLALMADAGHMLSDVAALGLSVFALVVARRPPTPQRSYGWLRTEILAALANGVTLVVISVVIFWQAYERIRTPQGVEGGLMLGVAGAGLAVNLGAALLLHRTSTHSLNLRGAYLHVLGDLLGSVAAVAAAVIVLTTGWTIADPLMSCVVAALILVGSWRLVLESVGILLEGTPPGIDLADVQKAISRVRGVEAVSDLHVWTLTSGVLAMSGHARIADLNEYQRILADIHRCMHDTFGISHVTVQLEQPAFYRIGEPREG
jgi:cobalt-zinc-cadmium efflux system protein